MYRKPKLMIVAPMAVLLLLVACNEVKYADRTLKVCEGLYTTVWESSKAVYANQDIPEADREAFKEKMLPLLQVAEGSIKAANISLQTYIKVKDDGAKKTLMSDFGSLVKNIKVLVESYNTVMKGFGKEVEIPEKLEFAFGLLS